jgi:hypothetical protein
MGGRGHSANTSLFRAELQLHQQLRLVIYIVEQLVDALIIQQQDSIGGFILELSVDLA